MVKKHHLDSPAHSENVLYKIPVVELQFPRDSAEELEGSFPSFVRLGKKLKRDSLLSIEAKKIFGPARGYGGDPVFSRDEVCSFFEHVQGVSLAIRVPEAQEVDVDSTKTYVVCDMRGDPIIGSSPNHETLLRTEGKRCSLWARTNEEIVICHFICRKSDNVDGPDWAIEGEFAFKTYVSKRSIPKFARRIIRSSKYTDKGEMYDMILDAVKKSVDAPFSPINNSILFNVLSAGKDKSTCFGTDGNGCDHIHYGITGFDGLKELPQPKTNLTNPELIKKVLDRI